MEKKNKNKQTKHYFYGVSMYLNNISTNQRLFLKTIGKDVLEFRDSDRLSFPRAKNQRTHSKVLGQTKKRMS